MLKSANTNTSHGSGHHYNFNDQNVTDLPPLKEAERITGIDRTNSRSIQAVPLCPVEADQIGGRVVRIISQRSQCVNKKYHIKLRLCRNLQRKSKRKRIKIKRKVK